jgi:hypothetical protein
MQIYLIVILDLPIVEMTTNLEVQNTIVLNVCYNRGRKRIEMR